MSTLHLLSCNDLNACSRRAADTANRVPSSVPCVALKCTNIHIYNGNHTQMGATTYWHQCRRGVDWVSCQRVTVALNTYKCCSSSSATYTFQEQARPLTTAHFRVVRHRGFASVNDLSLLLAQTAIGPVTHSQNASQHSVTGCPAPCGCNMRFSLAHHL